MHRLLLVIVFAFISEYAEAKCVTEEHEFHGLLEHNGSPLSDAKISFSTLDKLENEVRVSTLTNEQGKYSVKLRYSTYSGRSLVRGYDQCNFVLKEALVSFSTKENVSYEEALKLSGNRTTYNKFKNENAASGSDASSTRPF